MTRLTFRNRLCRSARNLGDRSAAGPRPSAPPPGNRPARKTKRTAGSLTFDHRNEAYKLFGVDVTRIPGLDGCHGPVQRSRPRPVTVLQFGTVCLLARFMRGSRQERRPRLVERRSSHSTTRRAIVPPRSALPASQQIPSRGLPAQDESQAGPQGRHYRHGSQDRTIFYALVTRQIEYDDSIWAARDEENRKRMENKLKRHAASLGFNLIPKEVP